MEAGFEEDVPYVCVFEEGDKVVYPHHGAGIVLKKESRELMGEEREYLTIKILHNELTVMVPCENAGVAGLRRVIDEVEIKKVTDVLTDDVSEMPKNWNRRFKYNREKIKTGDVFELAEVVRNLAIREMEKGLSTGEKQMYTRAKKILASEFMYALTRTRRARRSISTGCWRSVSPPPPRSSSDGLRRDSVSHRGIAAAGSGERLRAGGPKAFVPLAGRPMVEWSIEAFRRAGVEAIVVAVPPGARLRAGRLRAPRLRRAAGSAERPGPGRRRDPLGIGIERAGRGRDRAGRDPRRGPAAAGRRADRGRGGDAEGRPRGAGAIAAAPVADTIKRASRQLVLPQERGKKTARRRRNP